MSEERQPHPQEPAEGSEEAVNAPGVDRTTEGSQSIPDDAPAQAPHPQEPAEGGEDDVDAPGAEGPDQG
jgi:hypothetical protein